MIDGNLVFIIIFLALIPSMIIIPIFSMAAMLLSNSLVNGALKKRKDILELARDWGQIHCPGEALLVAPSWERRGLSLFLFVTISTQNTRHERVMNAPDLSKAIEQVVKRQTFFIAWLSHILLLPRAVFKPKDVMVLPIIPFFCEIPVPNSHEKMRAAKRLAEHALTSFGNTAQLRCT